MAVPRAGRLDVRSAPSSCRRDRLRPMTSPSIEPRRLVRGHAASAVRRRRGRRSRRHGDAASGRARDVHARGRLRRRPAGCPSTAPGSMPLPAPPTSGSRRRAAPRSIALSERALEQTPAARRQLVRRRRPVRRATTTTTCGSRSTPAAPRPLAGVVLLGRTEPAPARALDIGVDAITTRTSAQRTAVSEPRAASA